MKCPVCNTTVQVKISEDVMTVLEETHICPHGHYYYEYAYGNTQIIIGDKLLTFHYSDSKEDYKRKNKKYTDTVRKYQLTHKEDLVAIWI